MLDNFKSVPIDKKFGDLIVHWSINVQKKFKKNLSTNFVLIAVSVKVALTQYRNTVRNTEIACKNWRNTDRFTQIYERSRLL